MRQRHGSELRQLFRARLSCWSRSWITSWRSRWPMADSIASATASRAAQLAALDDLSSGGYSGIRAPRIRLSSGGVGAGSCRSARVHLATPSVQVGPDRPDHQSSLSVVVLPTRWFYDILRALDYFRDTQASYDPRIRMRWMSSRQNVARMALGHCRPNIPARRISTWKPLASPAAGIPSARCGVAAFRA